MRIGWLQHVPFEGLGAIEPWAEARGHALTAVRLWAGETPPDTAACEGLIVMGGPMSVHDESRYPWMLPEKRAIQRAIHAGQPILGVCLGAQLIAEVLGAQVRQGAFKEIGWFPVSLTPEAHGRGPFEDVPDRFEAFHWHGETFDVPKGATRAASSEACLNQAFVYDSRVLALQFHLETTPEGVAALVESCADDLVDGPYVQRAETMADRSRAAPPEGALLARILDRLFDGT